MSSNYLSQENEKALPIARIVSSKTYLRLSGVVAATLALMVDQASKAQIFANLKGGKEIVLLPVLSVLPGWNEGAAFGLGKSSAPVLLVILALAISAWLAVLLHKSKSRLETAGLGCAIGGALSNIGDRVRYGAVRDFIDVHWGAHHWPTFNAADMFVVVGLLIFVLADFLRNR